MVKAEENSSAFLYFNHMEYIKKLLYIVIISSFILSCATNKDGNVNNYISYKDNVKDEVSDTLRIANDSLEYEIIIIEPGFNQWLVTQRPRGYFGEQFLEVRNQQFVVEYNQRVLQPQRFRPDLYIQQINYEPHIHYGYEVNYLLYHYFLYFQQRYQQNFSFSRGRRY